MIKMIDDKWKDRNSPKCYIEIQECLAKEVNFTNTGKRIGKHETTVSKEIKLHTVTHTINEREIFVYAFRLGARIAIEVMSLDIE